LAELIGSLFPAIQGQTPVIADIGSMPDQISLINAILSQNPWQAAIYNARDQHHGFSPRHNRKSWGPKQRSQLDWYARRRRCFDAPDGHCHASHDDTEHKMLSALPLPFALSQFRRRVRLDGYDRDRVDAQRYDDDCPKTRGAILS